MNVGSGWRSGCGGCSGGGLEAEWEGGDEGGWGHCGCECAVSERWREVQGIETKDRSARDRDKRIYSLVHLFTCSVIEREESLQS